jgi:hypothetical protein
MTWTQSDPLFRFAPDLAIASPRRAQLYTFTLNNPLSYLDPDGLDSAGFSSFASHSNGNHVASVAMERPVTDGGNTSTTALREMVLAGIALPFREAWARENIACGGCLGIAAHEARTEAHDEPSPAMPYAATVEGVVAGLGGELANYGDSQLASGPFRFLFRRPARSRPRNWQAPPPTAKSKAWGHTFNRHGASKKNTKALKDRARSKGPQGQWVNDEEAAKFLSTLNVSGPAVVALPPGLGRLILPSGAIVPAQWALVVPFRALGFRSAFPVPGP